MHRNATITTTITIASAAGPRMHTIRLAAVIATAIGLALTTGCSAASDTGTSGEPAASTPVQSTPPATSHADDTAATGASVIPTEGTAGTTAGAAPVRRVSSEPMLTACSSKPTAWCWSAVTAPSTTS